MGTPRTRRKGPPIYMNAYEQGLGYSFISGIKLHYIVLPQARKVYVSTLVNSGKGRVDFFRAFIYTKVETGGVVVRESEFEFEQNVQSKRNDAVDSAVGFIVSFVFFTAIFVIGTVIEVLGK
jgi:hypothetical protein